jgi:hypothetical protein
MYLRLVGMLEPYSKEEKEYIIYLVKKYLPGITVSENKDCSSVMFEYDKDKASCQKKF